MSSELGSRFPEGWLWATSTEAARRGGALGRVVSERLCRRIEPGLGRGLLLGHLGRGRLKRLAFALDFIAEPVIQYLQRATRVL